MPGTHEPSPPVPRFGDEESAACEMQAPRIVEAGRNSGAVPAVDHRALGARRAMGRVGSEETAVGRRDARFVVETMAHWKQPEDSARNVAWVRDMFAAPKQLASGRPNFNFPAPGEDTGAFVHAVFGCHYQRLLDVKRTYDPSNLFRLNQNIA